MASLGQRWGHIMATFDAHVKCARCHDQGFGQNPCVANNPCKMCAGLIQTQGDTLSTPKIQIHTDKKSWCFTGSKGHNNRHSTKHGRQVRKFICCINFCADQSVHPKSFLCLTNPSWIQDQQRITRETSTKKNKDKQKEANSQVFHGHTGSITCLFWPGHPTSL